MKTKFFHLIMVFLIILSIHIFAVFYDLYSGEVLIDIPQHFLGGLFLAMIFVYTAQRHDYFSSKPSSFLFIFSVLSFALLGSFVWEIFEFLLWISLPDLSEQLKWYSPDILDALSDMAAGLLGSVSFVVITSIIKKRKKF